MGYVAVKDPHMQFIKESSAQLQVDVHYSPLQLQFSLFAFTEKRENSTAKVIQCQRVSALVSPSLQNFLNMSMVTSIQTLTYHIGS